MEELHLYRSVTGNYGGNNLCGRGKAEPRCNALPLDEILALLGDR